MTNKNIAVIIPNWNGADILTACLDSLADQTTKCTIIVVDNGSSDNSLKLLKQQYPKVLVLAKDKNYGFAGGVNFGIRYALEQNFQYIALLNNDAVAEADWLEHLLRTIQSNDGLGIVTSKMLRDDKKHLDDTGDFYSVWGMPFPRGRNQLDNGQFDSETEVFGASGGASLYRAEVFEEIGLFDERFFAYLEDVDISFRARLAGWDIAYEPKARVYHKVNATSSKLGSFSRYHTIKNFFALYTKNMPGWLYWKYLLLFLLQAVRLLISSVLRRGGIAYMRGFGRAMLNLPYMFRERRKIQKNRKVTPKQIDALLYKSRPPRIPSL